MPSLRASSLPLLSRCPAAAVAPAVRVASADAEARLGTGTHECLAPAIKGESWDASAAAARHGVDREELAMLVASGLRCWQLLAEDFPDPKTEQYLVVKDGELELTGHADILSVAVRGEVRVGDWFTGWDNHDKEQQLRGYCHLALLHHPDAVVARACQIGLRQQTADWFEWSRSELESWWEGLKARLVDGKKNYHAGRHCTYCPRALECPARRQLLRSSVEGLLQVYGDGGSFLNTEHDRASIYADMLDRMKLVDRACEAAREQIRTEVALAGGTLSTGDGRELALVQQERREIDVQRGDVALLSTLGAEVFSQLLRINKTEVEEAVRKSAPRGQKGKAVQELNARLEADGAIQVKTVERLECRRIVPHVEHSRNGSSTPSDPADAAG